MNPARRGTERLPRRLGVWSAVAVLVGSTIGSGIFRVPSSVAQDVATVGATALLWVLGGVIALCGALTLAELAVMFPRSGGIYVFLREAYGPIPAFLFGWTELVVLRPSSLGAIALLFAEYLGALVPLSPTGVRGVAAVAILVLAAANVRSVRWGAVVQNASTLAKVGALVALAGGVFVAGGGGGALARPIAPGPFLGGGAWGGFGIALVSVMWAYDGWADLTFMSGEVQRPDRTLPRALFGGTAAVMAIYLLVNAAYLYVLRIPDMAGRPLVAADAARAVLGAAGASTIAAMVMVSAFGALNGATMTGPRILFAMAEDGLFFRRIGAVHPRWETPWAATALAAALGTLYVSVGSFAQLADAFILGIWPFYALSVGAVFILRRRRPEADRPYRTVGYPWVPTAFLLASLAMLGNALAMQPGPTVLGLGIIAAGIPVYLGWRLGRGGATA